MQNKQFELFRKGPGMLGLILKDSTKFSKINRTFQIYPIDSKMESFEEVVFPIPEGRVEHLRLCLGLKQLSAID